MPDDKKPRLGGPTPSARPTGSFGGASATRTDPGKPWLNVPFEVLVAREVARARAITEFDPTFHNHHEAYATLLEELDEYWDEVKKKTVVKSTNVGGQRSEPHMLVELVQLASCAQRIAVDLLWFRGDSNATKGDETFATQVAAEIARVRSNNWVGGATLLNHHQGYAVLLEKLERYWHEVKQVTAEPAFGGGLQRPEHYTLPPLVELASTAQRIAEDVLGVRRSGG